MQRWYQPCMQEPKPRKEADESLSGCSGEAEKVVRAPTIHKGALVFAAERSGGGVALLGFFFFFFGGGGGRVRLGNAWWRLPNIKRARVEESSLAAAWWAGAARWIFRFAYLGWGVLSRWWY
ncbi:hypothetical protein GUJ93_ZPchr0006g40750 [Zizania palustris]|uniref:Uncharacterized protein n=1 Tax=Zizania palustris TaxID=103762 RepID=A0A8J5VHB0_ZIZPA|nr:hypothetical protein GUJ93_ZPchr0006g40750 [Zizania palustris]